jgi:hypothetical protein
MSTPPQIGGEEEEDTQYDMSNMDTFFFRHVMLCVLCLYAQVEMFNMYPPPPQIGGEEEEEECYAYAQVVKMSLLGTHSQIHFKVTL